VRARFLIDKSALARMPIPSVQARLVPILETGQAASCAIVDLEVLYSVRSAEDHERTRQRRRLAYEHVELNDAVFEQAMDTQGELAKSGRHRIPIPDLIIAAAAESARLTVLHYDHDYDVIAEVTGQAMEWVVPQGSI